VAGGGFGYGVATDRAGSQTFMRMAEVQAGLGAGIKNSNLVWIFDTPAAYKNFTERGWEFGAQATLAVKSGAAGGAYTGAVSVSPGV
jgi:lipid-binding SYLF domain-containing protein